MLLSCSSLFATRALGAKQTVHLNCQLKGFPGGPVAETVLPMQRAQVPHAQGVRSHVQQLKQILHAAAKENACLNGDQRSCVLQLRPSAAK